MHSAVVDYEALNVIIRYEFGCSAIRIVLGSSEFTLRRRLLGLELELDIKRGKCLLD